MKKRSNKFQNCGYLEVHWVFMLQGSFIKVFPGKTTYTVAVPFSVICNNLEISSCVVTVQYFYNRLYIQIYLVVRIIHKHIQIDIMEIEKMLHFMW